MTHVQKILFTYMLGILAMVSLSFLNPATAATARDLDRDSREAVQRLYETSPLAKDLAQRAKAVLIFPHIVKAGLIFGGGYGEGELVDDRGVDGYYNSVTGSWGLQAGAQSYGYVMYLMTDKAVNYIHKTHGWEIGVGPTVVVLDAGAAKNISSTTLKKDAYAFIFDQQGLMAGVSLEGTKISHIRR